MHLPNCLGCGAGIDEYDSGYYSRSMLCIPCYTLKASAIAMASCARCGVRIRQDEARSRRGSYYCNYCLSELDRIDREPTCPICARKIESYERAVKLAEGKTAHVACAEEKIKAHALSAVCYSCLRETSFFKILPNHRILCLDCARKAESGLASQPSKAQGASLVSGLMGSIKKFVSGSEPYPSAPSEVPMLIRRRLPPPIPSQ